MNRAEKAQEPRQEGEVIASGAMGAESREGHSAGRTGGESDLRCTHYAPDLQAQGDCINCGWAWEYHQ